ncbi:hypothetical protein FNF27_05103 [Cafeteria roenbergensis]|uniref:NECAP PHear domain-containing protein n=1 Tax=Cafeteria roenbergensis TaxID=33653 RepID=A0A5A8E6Q4_CAFRO|nr:hypothetical protein FNF27_05103 [Cafeteria roenbergensis]
MAASADASGLDDIDFVRLVKDRVFGFKIPPRRGGASGYVAAEWKEHQIWVGELRVVSRGPLCRVVLTNKSSGNVFAVCPIRKGGPSAVEKASDSSRYFALRIEDPRSGRHMWLGIGFSQRSDAFDFSVALQEHEKDVDAAENPVAMDLGDAADIDLGGLPADGRIKISLKKPAAGPAGGRAAAGGPRGGGAGAGAGAKPRRTGPIAGGKFALPKPSTTGALAPPKGPAVSRASRAGATSDVGAVTAGVGRMSLGAAPAPAAAAAGADADEDDFFGGGGGGGGGAAGAGSGTGAGDDDWTF